VCVSADEGGAGHAPARAECWPTKAYSSRAIRSTLRKRGIAATIPEPANQQTRRTRRGGRGGRPPTFDSARYKHRNVVERCINKLKQYRAVATRYDKREYMYQGKAAAEPAGRGRVPDRRRPQRGRR
jgi:transposase